MQNDNITVQYKSDMQQNEKEMSDLQSRRRHLEKKRQDLFEWKRRDMAYYNQLRSELHGSGRKQDLKLIDTLMDTTQHACRRIEQGFEQEHQDLEQQLMQLGFR